MAYGRLCWRKEETCRGSDGFWTSLESTGSDRQSARDFVIKNRTNEIRIRLIRSS